MYGSQMFATTEYGGNTGIRYLVKKIIDASLSAYVSFKKDISMTKMSYVSVSSSIQKMSLKNITTNIETTAIATKTILFSVLSVIIIGVADITKQVSKNISTQIETASSVVTSTIRSVIIDAYLSMSSTLEWAWNKTIDVIIEGGVTIQKTTSKNISAYSGILAIVKDMFYKIKYPKNSDTYDVKYPKNGDSYTKKYY